MGEKLLFEGLSLSVRSGEIWAITGPSGAGKSSLLKVLSGELLPNEGTVELFGRQGEIPQALALNEELTAGENVRVGQFKGLSFVESLQMYFQRDERIVPLLARWGVKDPLQRVRTLSGGEKQRVAMVRATLEPWQILFADEPISQLDDENARAVLLSLKAEALKRGGALVIVLHHRALAEEIATNHLVLGNVR